MDYKEEYHKIKKKYLELKDKLFNDITSKNYNQTGGNCSGCFVDCDRDGCGGKLRLDGTFINEVDGHRYKVYLTRDSQRFSFREVPLREFDKNDLTNNLRRPSRDKILYINDIDTFNYFSNKYGRYDRWDIYVAWDKLAKDFKGFYLNKNNKDLYLHVYAKARKGNFRMGSWWAGEYQNLTNDVMVFR